MLFHRLDFLLFFLVVFLGYASLRHRAQNVWLLAASYFFYAMWDWRFLGLIAFSTLLDFFVGWAIGRGSRYPRLWLTASVVVNLSLLGVFKYFGFFAESFERLLGLFGFQVGLELPLIVLPVGISFYTFQSLSYTIDVYRGDTEAIFPRDLGKGVGESVARTAPFLVDFALYVAFFPQLVAGPIERSTRLLGQLRQSRAIDGEGIAHGLWLFGLGLVMKVAIADEIAGQVDAVFADLGSQSLHWVYFATLAFAIQIYCDFAGYTYMARGVAEILGIRLMVNFRQPYLAASFSDFWRRWHISLSTWIRDYLYIPLGGNRLSAPRTYFNLIVTMGLAGLWHGSTWAFVFWGLLHGFYLSTERLFLRSWLERPASAGIDRALRWIYRLFVFQAVLLGWFVFRAGNLREVLGHLPALIAGSSGGSTTWFPELADLLPFVSFLVLFVLFEIPSWAKDRELRPSDYSAPSRFVFYLLLVTIFLAAGGEKDAPFIYFQF